MNRLILILCLLSMLFGGALRADDANAQAALNSRLRAALQQAAQQAQDLQAQVAAAQAAQTQSEREKTDLQEKLDESQAQLAALSKQEADEKAAAAATEASLNANIGVLNKSVVNYKATLDAWMKDDKANAKLAAEKEAARAQIAEQGIIMQRTLDARERENIELFRLGNEILTRYQKLSLGESLEAREPFLGFARTKLETQVQDYRDKLSSDVITPGQPLTPITPSRPATAITRGQAATAINLGSTTQP